MIAALWLIPSLKAFSSDSEPDWRARYEELLTNERLAARCPTAGQRIKIERRIGGNLYGTLVALTSTSVTIRADSGVLTYFKSQLTAESAIQIFAEDSARAKAAAAVKQEKNDYDHQQAVKRQNEALERQEQQRQHNLQMQERERAENEARLIRQAQAQREQERESALMKLEAIEKQKREDRKIWTTIIGFITVGVLVYLLPYIVAGSRRHHNRAAIFALNLFLGWTFLGWVIALVWACTKVEKK